MNWILLAVVSAAFAANIVNAVQNQAFKERAEIYSSEYSSCMYSIASFYLVVVNFHRFFFSRPHYEVARMRH